MTQKELSNEEQKRIDAINLYLDGEKPSDICKQIKRSRKWFYKWKRRFQIEKDEWYKEKSKKPKVIANKTKPDLESKIVTIRKELMSGEKEGYEYSCVGVLAIQHKFSELNYSENQIPKASVIKRVIRENKLRVRKKKRYKRIKSKQRYRKIFPTKINELYYFDFKGPLYLRGNNKPIYGACLKDAISQEVVVDITTTKSMDYVLSFFIELFKKRDIPKYLQMDNATSFIGNWRHKRFASRFIRFLLHIGVEPIFVAPRKPWMNGGIEEFVKLFSEKFWVKKEFGSKEDVKKESKKFENNHNKLQKWKLRNRNVQRIRSKKLNKNFHFNPKSHEVTASKIHFIREVKNNGKIRVFNEEIMIGKGYSNERIWVTIDVIEQTLRAFHKAKRANKFKEVKTMKYKIKNL